MQLQARLLHTPEGFRDMYDGECRDEKSAEHKIIKTMHLMGFEDVRTPGLEYFDVYKKERGTVPGNEMYRFFDADGNTLALRPDITPGIARLSARYFADSSKPLRFCYCEQTYRNIPGLRGKLKERTQTGVELIGDDSVLADADVIITAVKSLLSVGMKEFQIEVGSAAFLNSLIEPLSLSDEDMVTLRNHIDNKNKFALKAFLDTKRDRIPKARIDVLTGLTDDFGTLAEIMSMANIKPVTEDDSFYRTYEALKRLKKIDDILGAYGVSDYVTYDLGLIGKLGYYTGIIIRGYTYGSGESIVSGGRYDDLVSQFGKNAPAVGMAINMDLLIEALRKSGINPHKPGKLIHIITPPDRMQDAVKLRSDFMEKEKASDIIIDENAVSIRTEEEDQ